MDCRLRVAWLALLFVALLAIPARAQVAQAELRGTVADENGGVLPGVTVTATHVDTGMVRTTVTSATGTYVMPALPTGLYKVTAELTGFGTLAKEGIRLAVGESASLGFTLKVASVAETITVQGESPLVDTKKSELSGRVEQTQVENLPVNGRDWLGLVSLVPGARGYPGQIQAGSSGSDMAKYQVDGVDVTNQCCGSSNQGYSMETIEEFKVETNRYDAEYGRVNGAVINAVTKAGTNKVRASGFGFYRQDHFFGPFHDAPSFFTGQISPFDQKQTGINSGGPIVQNKAFYFASYEYQKLGATARPNTGFAQFDVDLPADTTSHFTTVRVDFQPNTVHRLFGRASIYDWKQLNVGVNGTTTESGGYSRPSSNHDFSLGDTWVIGSRAVNEIRAGFSAINNKLDSNCHCVQLNFPSAIIGSPTNSPQWWKEMNLQVNDLFSYFVPGWHGEHSMKMGFQFFRPHFWGAFPDPPFGQFTFTGDPANFNDPSTYPAPTRYVTQLGDTSYSIMNPTYGAFFQDNWTLNAKLTLNLGIRYDLETGTSNTDVPSPIQPGARPLDKDNVAPRFGFAYDVHADGRSVVRGGIGRYFDKVMLNLTSNERRTILGQFIGVTIVNPSFTDPLGGRTFEDFKNQKIPAGLTVLDNNYQTPYNDQISVGLAQQLATGYAMQIDYVHSRGHNEPMTPQINYFEDPVTHLPRNPAIFGRPYPAYTNIVMTTSTGKSAYDGLQLGFTGRTRRVTLGGTYTLSRTYDNHASNRGGTPTNWFNLEDEYTYAGSDQRNRFVVNAVTMLPYGVQASAILFFGSPRPIDVSTNLDPFGLGYSPARWLDATGRTLPRYSERTGCDACFPVSQNGAVTLESVSGWDRKLDLRFAKSVKVRHLTFQGMLDVFNALNIRNAIASGYTRNYFSRTYLQPSTSTNLFYQPRQIQFGFRVSY
jgi:Carboxypeptidase regulatory-like domain/TonB dependent receptor